MKMSFLRVLIVCSLGAIASTTQAGLTHVNDDTFDALVSQDNEVTRDSDLNGGLYLDWLDIDAYLNTSWTAVEDWLGLPGHILEDWRHATRDEVGVYFGHLGLHVTNYPNLTENEDGGVSGTAAVAYTGFSASEGVSSLADGMTSSLYFGSEPPEYYTAVLYAGDYSDTRADVAVSEDNPYQGIGHWLVRASPSESVVPEPSTFSMLAFGCIAMAGLQRKTWHRFFERRNGRASVNGSFEHSHCGDPVSGAVRFHRWSDKPDYVQLNSKTTHLARSQS